MNEININVTVSSEVYTAEQVEQIRQRLRREILGWIFNVVDSTPLPNCTPQNHLYVDVNGDIK